MKTISKDYQKCAWCNKPIGDNDPCLGIDIKAPNLREPIPDEEPVMTVTLLESGKDVDLIIPTKQSEGKKEGADLFGMFCSKECAMSFKEASGDQFILEELPWC